MFLEHTESNKENFTIKLIQEILNNMYQYYTDNHTQRDLVINLILLILYQTKTFF